MTLRKCDTLLAALLLLLGAWIMAEGLRYGIARDGMPGAGLFPLLAGIALAALSAANLFRSIRGLETIEGVTTRRQLLPVAGICAALVLFVIVVPYLGILLPLPFIIVALSYLVEPRRGVVWFLQISVAAIIFTAVSYVLFGVGLGVLLPEGPLGF